ncbi:hypothetical protein FQN55_003204 [Onygenales sp. PD_40]|nr:hypothetical protein FQN55_003204 [Onygenales sp. PD_40]KAK2774348.1 hypothetical protein FQN53_003663 [Emmonsiellopsis sp. PD_33]KAK2796775.1 hypothetical protein FQN51_008999 [Onygenales sp. PD_10]
MEDQIVSAASESLRVIHALGMLHCEAETRSLFWTEEGGNVLVIDFERAEILRPGRAPLESKWPKEKRKRGSESTDEETKLAVGQGWIDSRFKRELEEMIYGQTAANTWFDLLLSSR